MAAKAVKEFATFILSYHWSLLISPLSRLNPRVEVTAVTETLLPSNAINLLSSYDVILDCTDNAPTRYLLSDTAVFLGKPLVSGAAQRYDGQMCTYNLGDGPCYRCLFPVPPPFHSLESCEDHGILGVVAGMIGSIQALETIKILTGLHGRSPPFVDDARLTHPDPTPSLLLFSALNTTPFRSIKLRSRKPTCPACGTTDQKIGQIRDIDYVRFCGGQRPNWVELGLTAAIARIPVTVRPISFLH